MLQVLRKRLVGELFGDAEDVAATFDPTFTVMMHSRRDAYHPAGRHDCEKVFGSRRPLVC